MALLDELLGGLTGVRGSPFQGVLMNMLGRGNQTGSTGGGLGGLLLQLTTS